QGGWGKLPLQHAAGDSKTVLYMRRAGALWMGRRGVNAYGERYHGRTGGILPDRIPAAARADRPGLRWGMARLLLWNVVSRQIPPGGSRSSPVTPPKGASRGRALDCRPIHAAEVAAVAPDRDGLANVRRHRRDPVRDGLTWREDRDDM